MSESIKHQRKQVGYWHLPDETDLFASEAKELLLFEGMCRVISHRIKTQVVYLIEWPNGERTWKSMSPELGDPIKCD